MTLTWKNVGYGALGVVVIALLVLVGIVAFPGLVGGDDAFIVTSGSMSPTLEPGDVVVTQDVDPEEIETGDVVTFHDGSGADTGFVTHRVVDVVEEEGELYFQLQGDANDEPDEGLVPAEYAHGERHLDIPYLGHLLIFARSSLGLFVLVLAPGIALMASGSWQLLREFGYFTDEEEPPELEAVDDPPALEAAEEGTLEGDDAEELDADEDRQPSETDATDTEDEQ